MKSLLTYGVNEISGTNYGLNEHEHFDQYGSFTIPSKIQVWWIYWINWLSYRVNKDDGNRQTDRRTDGQTQVATITLRPKRPRVKNHVWILSQGVPVSGGVLCSTKLSLIHLILAIIFAGVLSPQITFVIVLNSHAYQCIIFFRHLWIHQQPVHQIYLKYSETFMQCSLKSSDMSDISNG